MNDSILYFLLYTAGCFSIGFALGGVWELRRNIGRLDALKLSFDMKFDELSKLADRRVAAVEDYYEKRMSSITKCNHCCDNSHSDKPSNAE